MNDLVRGKTRDPDTGKIKLYWEVIAGATAGASQVVFTNPLESMFSFANTSFDDALIWSDAFFPHSCQDSTADAG